MSLRSFVTGLGTVALTAPLLMACPGPADETGSVSAPSSDAGRRAEAKVQEDAGVDQAPEEVPRVGGDEAPAKLVGNVGGSPFGAKSSAGIMITYAAKTPDNANPFPVTTASLVFHSKTDWLLMTVPTVRFSPTQSAMSWHVAWHAADGLEHVMAGSGGATNALSLQTTGAVAGTGAIGVFGPPFGCAIIWSANQLFSGSHACPSAFPRQCACCTATYAS